MFQQYSQRYEQYVYDCSVQKKKKKRIINLFYVKLYPVIQLYCYLSSQHHKPEKNHKKFTAHIIQQILTE